MKDKRLPPAIFLMGPTASGKTDLSIRMAKLYGCEIISVDSAMIYRQMNIGTAKPTLSERGGITHHMIDILDPSESFSTAEFRNRAVSIMEELSNKGKIPLLVGGTMLYFNSLLKGLAPLPNADTRIRDKLEREAAESGWQALHERLREIDPVSAVRIHPNDPQRIQRALEVFEITGKPISAHLHDAENNVIPYDIKILVIAPQKRNLLHEKIAARFKNMVEQGLIQEVEKLYLRGDLSEKNPSVRCVGYRQVWSFLEGEIDYDEMIERAIAATRQLAKRQFTWLRKIQEGIWHDLSCPGEEQLIREEIEEFLVER
ncbi:MAG: tRNA (adenosine(37)-N6)-dimethylallyltransferase MiaA [Gammaproteobacteria bacterium]